MVLLYKDIKSKSIENNDIFKCKYDLFSFYADLELQKTLRIIKMTTER
mgnify:CR=1 FL=1